MERIYVIQQTEEGDLITQDGFLLTTEGSFPTIDLITQSGDFILTQSGDILGGRIYDDTDFENIGYRTITNIDTLYNPTITEKIYGN